MGRKQQKTRQEITKRTAISKAQRFDIFDRDGFKCRYCGQKSPDVVLHIDHIKPVAKGGTNDINNLITACSACNAGKSDKELTGSNAENVAELSRAEQLNTTQWEDKRDSIFERDGYKCARCGVDDDTIEAHLIDETLNENLWDIHHGMFITLCRDCHVKVHNMMTNLEWLLQDMQRSYRFHKVDSLNYVQELARSVYVSDPDSPHVKNIFNAIDLYNTHNDACDEVRAEYEEAE